MKLFRSMPASILESISQALKAGRLKPPYTAFAVAEWAPQVSRELLASEFSSLQTLGFTPFALAATLDHLDAHASRPKRSA